MKRIFRAFAAFLMSGAMTPFAAAGLDFELKKGSSTEENSIVASVNGEAITLREVLEESRSRELPLYAANDKTETYEAVKNFRRQVLDEIIERKLLLDEYARQPFEIPSQYLESFLDDLAVGYNCRTRSEFAAKLRSQGSSLEEFRERARKRLIVQAMLGRLFASRVNVTPKMVADYLASRKGEPRKEVHFFLVRSEKALEIGGEKEFLSLAKTHSPQPDGDFSWCDVKRLRPEFRDALEKIKVGTITPAIKLDDGFFYYLLKKEERFSDPEGVGAEKAREILEREQKERLKAEYLERLKKNSIIRYY